MHASFEKIGLVGRSQQQGLDLVLQELLALLLDRGHEVILEDRLGELLPGHSQPVGSRDAIGEEADLVIMALGFEPEDLPTLWEQPELPVTRWGTIKAAFTTGETELENVYAVGDIVRGASLVVWAIRDGRDCAQAILEKFNAKEAIAAE